MKKTAMFIAILLAATATASAQSTRLDLKTQGKNVDFANATLSRPFRTGTVLPSTCLVGEMFFKTDAPGGANTFGCVAANTWMLQGGSGSSATDAVLQVGYTSATTLTIGQACSSTNPCRFRVGANVYSRSAPATIQVSSGSGTVYVYAGSNGDLAVGAASTSAPALVCTGCTAVTPVTSFPLDAIPLAVWTANNGAWDPAGTDQRAVLARERKLLAGTNIVLTELADSVTVAAASGFDPMDMSLDIVIDKPGSKASESVPGGFELAAVGNNCSGDAEAGSGNDVVGYRVQTGATSADGCYLVARGLSSAAYYPDITSAANFRPFLFKARLKLAAVSQQKAFFGLFASTSSAAGSTDGVYLEYDPAVSANWQCTIRSAGVSTRVNTGTAAASSYLTLAISATASGTLACQAGAASVTTAASFPTAVQFGFFNQTTTAASQQLVISDVRRKVSALSR